MSYSICLKCKEMVSSYQKYCKECEKSYSQNSEFWKNAPYDIFNDDEKRNKELISDLKMFGGRKA